MSFIFFLLSRVRKIENWDATIDTHFIIRLCCLGSASSKSVLYSGAHFLTDATLEFGSSFPPKNSTSPFSSRVEKLIAETYRKGLILPPKKKKRREKNLVDGENNSSFNCLFEMGDPPQGLSSSSFQSRYLKPLPSLILYLFPQLTTFYLQFHIDSISFD